MACGIPMVDVFHIGTGTHNFVGSAPVYQPFGFPNGVCIIIFGMSVNKTVEILKAGTSSTRVWTCSWCRRCPTTKLL